MPTAGRWAVGLLLAASEGGGELPCLSFARSWLLRSWAGEEGALLAPFGSKAGGRGPLPERVAASCALASQGSKAGGDGEGEGPVGKVALQNKILNKLF